MNYQLGIFDHRHLRQHETAVDKVNKGKGRIVNARFGSMCSHYLFDPDGCRTVVFYVAAVIPIGDTSRRTRLR